MSKTNSKNFLRRSLPLACALMLTAHASIIESRACPCAEIPKPPATEVSDSIAEGLKFSHTEQYEKEFSEAVEGARKACEKHKGEPRVAVVSDIDETLLDNRDYYEKHQKDFDWDKFFGWMEAADAPTLKKTAEFLAWARDNGFAIFLVTGRREKMRACTIENLVRQKVSYDGLYMRGNDDKNRPEDFKTGARQDIEKIGFKIITNIGDQLSDLYGGHSEDCQKLPNRMYYIP